MTKLSLFVCSGDLKWVVMDGGSEKWLVAGGRRWWPQNYAWLWLVLGGGCKIMAGSGWSWMVVDGRTMS